jgi:uncharacterized protein (UPF0332 family)
MGERFKQCIKERGLQEGKVERDIIEKEIGEAERDLDRAENSASEGDFKWATIQAYYSMFHTAKALVLSRGYREKSHLCLSVALRHLFVDGGRLQRKHYERFMDSMALRKDADYGLVYSESSAAASIGWAREFLEDARSTL